MKTLALLVALLLAAVPVFGATIPGTIVAAKVTTGNTANTFSIGDTGEMLGTTKQVPNSTSMMAITPERRSIGMTCYVIDEDNEYRLVGGIDNTNWVLLQHYVPQPPPTPVTNYIIAGWWTNDTFIQEYFRTNIWIDQYMSNWFATNYNVYSWPTNIYTTNIIDLDSYISNYWATNWDVFPNYVSNYFWTNITAAVTNIIYNWASHPVSFDSITVTNGITNLSLTPQTVVMAGGARRLTSIPNGVGVLTNDGSGNFDYVPVQTLVSNVTINTQKFYAGDTYIQGGMFRFVSDWPGPTNTFTFSTNCFAYQSAVPVNVQDFVGGTNGYAGDSELLLFNGSGSNFLVYFSGTNLWSLDGTNQYILTNGDISIFGIQRISTTSLVGSNLTLLVQRWAHKLQ